MTADLKVEHPIFIVGCGRSGTTILYQLMSGHPDLAWFSDYTQRWPKFPQVAFLSHLYTMGRLRRWSVRRLPAPVEGYPLWDYCKPVLDSPNDPPLTEHDVHREDIDHIRRIVALHLRYQRKPRFINKNTRNTRRIRFLNAIFGDALFVHIVRDPRATVNSLLHVDFWPNLRVWCQGKVTPREWEAAGNDAAVLAARLWVAEVQRALDDKEALSKDRYLQLRYEELVARPREVLSDILAFAGLKWSDRFTRFVASFRLENKNSKYKTQLTTERIAKIERIVAPLAGRLGYELDATSAES